MQTVFDYIYSFITTYFLPTETAFPQWGNILIALSAVCAVGVFWAWIVRPFWWFFKYGLWGGSKKHRKLNNWDD